MNDAVNTGSGMIDAIDAVRDAETVDFVVTNPTDDAPLITLVLAGPAHKSRLDLNRKHKAIISKAAEKARNPRKAISQKYMEEGEEMEIELLVAATLDWKGPHGDPATEPFDAGKVEAWYRGKSWLRRQVLDKLADDAGFIRT